MPDHPWQADVEWEIDSETWKLVSFIDAESGADYQLTKKAIPGHSEAALVIELNDVDLDLLAKLLAARREMERR